MQYQRPDGRIPHEIAQTVKLIDWWKDYPYGTASADGTPLFLVGFADYVRASGDVAFAREHWDSLWRAYQFLKSTYSASGLSQNLNIGHGWIEGGPLRPQPGDMAVPHDPPLVPISGEFYQAGVGIAGVEVARHARASRWQERCGATTRSGSWPPSAPRSKRCSGRPRRTSTRYAVDTQGQRIDKPSVLGTVPMWFGLTDARKSDLFLNTIAAPDHQTDWGPRIISNQDPLYGATGYHYGSVWPLFTGWASVAGYRYHRAHYGYENLMANAQLAHTGSPGRTTEVSLRRFLHPAFHQHAAPDLVVGHGDQPDPARHDGPGGQRAELHRDLRASRSRRMERIRYQECEGRNDDGLTLRTTLWETISRWRVQRHGSGKFELDFSPAFSLRAKVLGAEVNGRKSRPKMSANESDQHATVSVPISADKTTIHLRVTGELCHRLPYPVPADGAASST